MTRPPLAVRVAVFFLAFLAMTRIGYLFAYAPYTGIGVFWPSAGLCVAVLLLEERRAWPAYVAAIFVGELVGVAARGLPLPVCLVWAVAASGEPLLSAWLLRHVRRSGFLLDRLDSLFALVGVAVLLSPALAASLSATAAVLWLGAPSWSTSWMTWAFGDALGVVVVAPLLLVWLREAPDRTTVRALLLGFGLVVAMVVATEALFGGGTGHTYRLALGFLTFPLILWAAVRFGPRGVTLVAAILNILAAYHTTRGEGLFAHLGSSPLERLVTLQAYLSFVTLSSLALAAALYERRQGERQLQQMIDNSTAVIFAKRSDGRYLFVNRAFERISGRSRSAIVGHTAQELWSPGFAQAITQADVEVLGTGRPCTHEEQIPTPGGRRTFVAVRFPLGLEHGVPHAICGMATDITERKTAEEALRRSEERLGLVVAATHDAVYDWNPVTGELWRNERHRELYGPGWGAGWWQGRIHPADRRAVTESLRACQASGARTWAAEYRFRRDDGTYAHVLDNAYLLYDEAGRPSRIVGALADITERRVAQEELQRVNLDLEQRVERRTAELGAAYREMESFSYSISHDLRGPLRAINGFGKVLLEDHATLLPAEAAACVARIRAASERMGQLIDDLLALSRAGRAEIRRMRVDVSETAAAVLRELRESEPTRTVVDVIEPGISVDGDPGLLRIVLQNLLANAWKFTGHRAIGRIEVGQLRVGDENAIYVRDDGAGFDDRYAGKLFRPFERLHGTTEFPGTGIGLATIQRIVTRHGGRVWATGAVDVGATFYFTLPAEPTAPS